MENKEIYISENMIRSLGNFLKFCNCYFGSRDNCRCIGTDPKRTTKKTGNAFAFPVF